MAACDDINLVEPDQPTEAGCPILTKKRAVIVDKGTCVTVQWPVRNRNGEDVDLSGCFPTESSSSLDQSSSLSETESGSVEIRFANCDNSDIVSVAGEVYSADDGVIRFVPPASVMSRAGIYQMSVGIKDADDTLILVDTGLFSVEKSLFGDLSQQGGPPTIRDLRIHLRDNPLENELLEDYEFDVSEILHAVVYPIGQWNETPPPIARFTCGTFPYGFHWRQAVVGELLRTAAHHYVRNEYLASHGGIQGNLKSKHRQYLELAELYSSEWRRFIRAKKVELNAGQGFGSLYSSYSSW